jgi:Xaa-Pro aminopeptidase
MNYFERLQKLQKKLQELQCDGLIVEDPVNLYYMTGISLSSGILIVHAQGGILLVDNRYEELCRRQSLYPVILSDETPFLAVLSFPELQHVRTIGFDAESMTFKRFQELELVLQKAGKYTLKPLNNPIQQLRMVKDREEIALLRAASALGYLGFEHVSSLLREGISEIELAVELEIFWKRRGGKSISFDPIIAFGANASMPHYRAGETVLKQNTEVLIDIGVSRAHYHSDMTRVVFFGKPDNKIKEIYAIVEEAQQQAIALCKPGIPVGDIDRAARGVIEKHGYGSYFKHGTGHGVGLEVHEAPWIRKKPPYCNLLLQPGMVFTIEPGIYLSGIGGVRIENMVLINETGCENLTKK